MGGGESLAQISGIVGSMRVQCVCVWCVPPVVQIEKVLRGLLVWILSGVWLSRFPEEKLRPFKGPLHGLLCVKVEIKL